MQQEGGGGDNEILSERWGYCYVKVENTELRTGC
jgi:hypothetical protein